uniref:Carbohydrate kinase n=1 Tax=Mesocestoides corti TaxID=53468 RepID=A0A5K3FAE3_MESCO
RRIQRQQVDAVPNGLLRGDHKTAASSVGSRQVGELDEMAARACQTQLRRPPSASHKCAVWTEEMLAVTGVHFIDFHQFYIPA